MDRRFFLRVIAFLALLAVVFSCSKPKPPQITVKSGQVTRIDPQGIEVVAHIEAFNPNSYALSVRGISGTLLLDGRVDLGKVTIDKPISIPAGGHVPIDVPIASTWNDLAAVAALAASNRSIPYTMTGTVTVGGESLSVDVPYRLDGTITHEQIVRAALGSIPKLPLKLP